MKIKRKSVFPMPSFFFLDEDKKMYVPIRRHLLLNTNTQYLYVRTNSRNAKNHNITIFTQKVFCVYEEKNSPT